MLIHWHLCEKDYSMKQRLFNRKHLRTAHIQLDPKKCDACWKCIDNCSNQVISKVDLPWHKHSLIVAPEKCTGCLICIKMCPNGSFIKIEKVKQVTNLLA